MSLPFLVDQTELSSCHTLWCRKGRFLPIFHIHSFEIKVHLDRLEFSLYHYMDFGGIVLVEKYSFPGFLLILFKVVGSISPHNQATPDSSPLGCRVYDPRVPAGPMNCGRKETWS
jgi:hypothetical protein